MKKFFTLAAVMLSLFSISLKADEQQDILDTIRNLPLPFTYGNVAQSNYTIKEPYFWQVTVQDDVYHAAIMFENYPDGIHSDSMRFLSLFMVWKNGHPHYRQVIENDPKHIEITDCKLIRHSDSSIYLILNYDFDPYFEDSFNDHERKCNITLSITGHSHASVADFESLAIGDLTIRNGEARAANLPVPDPEKSTFGEQYDYRRQNPVYQIVFPHCYVTKNDGHTFHTALIDCQHENLLAVYIWKDRKLYSVYLLDHYEQFYSTPDRMKIESGAGTYQLTMTSPDGQRLQPLWDNIVLRYTVEYHCDCGMNNFYRYNKYNYVKFYLQRAGIHDMRQQRNEPVSIYTPFPADE
ncbi:MAG: hypothetical protein E7053_02250 [Lentisphaerae bacterium]|nr:hypothetical protein [Lentisphaerota bacterium]